MFRNRFVVPSKYTQLTFQYCCAILQRMFIRTKSTPNSPRKSVQIVASVRDGDKIRQKIIRHVGIAMNEAELEKLKEVAQFIKTQLEEAHQPSVFGAEEATQQALQALQGASGTDKKPASMTVDLQQLRETQRTVMGIHEVYGEVYQQLGFDRVWGKSQRRASRREMLKQVTLARVAQPGSKRDSVRLLERDFGVRLNLDSVYRMMDDLDEASVEQIQQCAYRSAQQLLGKPLDVLFYDCTTLYFESFWPDSLRQQGFSKDHKAQETQVLLALMVTRDGLPVGYEVFPGATFEGHTLIPVIDALKKRLSIERVVFVADRGLFNEGNLKALEQAGIDYVVGARLKNQTTAVKAQILEAKNYQHLDEQTRFQRIEHQQGRELIVSYQSSRAEKDRHERNKAIGKMKKKLAASSKTKNFISHSGYKKYLNLDQKGEVTLNEAAIEASAQWDGIHGVITNVKEETPQAILAHYHSLWQVEESFRINKHDLKVRPIFHWKPDRIRAHLAIAFMAFCCVRHLEHRVKLQYKKLSPEVIRRELCHVQVSLLKHKKNKHVYGMPSAISVDAENIYRVIGLKPKTTAYLIS